MAGVGAGQGLLLEQLQSAALNPTQNQADSALSLPMIQAPLPKGISSWEGARTGLELGVVRGEGVGQGCAAKILPGLDPPALRQGVRMRFIHGRSLDGNTHWKFSYFHENLSWRQHCDFAAGQVGVGVGAGLGKRAPRAGGIHCQDTPQQNRDL